MVFQRPVMLRRSALGNVVYGLKLAGISQRERELRASDVLEAVGLASVAGRPARVLSGGEQQKLALARAWALGPEVLFLDEPTANLDPGATRDVESIIGQIRAGGTKIVMTTHNLGQAKRLGDEILFLNQGRLVERSPIESFFSKPASTDADAFIRGELPWN
jgi:tungstate transport system ATP-binding protein